MILNKLNLQIYFNRFTYQQYRLTFYLLMVRLLNYTDYPIIIFTNVININAILNYDAFVFFFRINAENWNTSRLSPSAVHADKSPRARHWQVAQEPRPPSPMVHSLLRWEPDRMPMAIPCVRWVTWWKRGFREQLRHIEIIPV